MSSEIAVPFRLDANNRIATVSNPNEQIRQHVMSLVNTQPGERVVLGDYGVPLTDVLFEEDDEDLATDLAADITARMAEYEPGVVLQDVQLIPEQEGGTVRFEISYERADAPESDSFSRQHANIATISAAGTVSEVILG